MQGKRGQLDGSVIADSDEDEYESEDYEAD
jgi:hypothetical protein